MFDIISNDITLLNGEGLDFEILARLLEEVRTDKPDK